MAGREVNLRAQIELLLSTSIAITTGVILIPAGIVLYSVVGFMVGMGQENVEKIVRYGIGEAVRTEMKEPESERE